ncbi:MAG: PQQ-binding-like beta-propeller repeat protein, partial [Planctomycetes bacterium]|nr:PQQ-binding-like beta-propeller repeat protein [Planctomycetota bacterium]
HYLHGPGNNAVADDDRVGPPRHLQWKAGPTWSRSHEFASSVQALVSAGGRLIGIIDEGIIGQPRGVPAFWTLIAYDAFNGIQLWRRPCDRVHPHALVAVDDRVYVTLRNRGPLSILDAATGKVRHTVAETGKVNEIAFCEDRVILSTQLTGEQGKSGPHLAAADPDDGHLLWKRPVKGVAANTLVVGGGRVCYHNKAELVCLSLEDGQELWRSPVKNSGRGYAILYQGTVFLTGGATRAFSLETGSPLWTGPDGNPHARNPPGLFGAGGLVWRAWEHVDPRSFLWQHREETRNGYDPATGEVRKTVSAERLVTAGHHIRCYPAKATSRYLLLNKRGVEFFDLEGTNHMRANWTRGACGFGMLPANGFLYAPPGQCFCYPGVLLTGFNALSAAREISQNEAAQHDEKPRLERGPAYGSPANAMTSDPSAADWPTYRHDVFRSGAIAASLPVELERVWETSLCRPAFAPADATAAGDQEDIILLPGAAATIHGEGARKSGDAVIAWRGADTSISWETRIDSTGKQPVWILQSNMGQGGSVFELSVGREKLTGKIRHTESWDEHVWVRVGQIEISEPGPFTVRVKPVEQVEGRLGNVAAVAIGGDRPPAGAMGVPKLRERPHGGLTPPVAADGKVFVAEPDAHMVHAVSAEDGHRLWSFTADGRVDSPPTIYQGLCIFGCTDGHVYCLSASTGRLVWRFRAAPEERQVCVMGQVESAWPVHGSVLVRDDKVYLTAGRSSHLDGGIYVYALDAKSGEIVHETRLDSEEPDVSKYGGRPFDTEGSRSDLLVAGAEDIYLFQTRFNSDLTLQPMPRITKLGDRECEPHLMTNDGFLDKTWFNRTYWSHSDRWPGYYFTYRGPKSGQILVFDDTATYALKVYTERFGHSPEFKPGGGYRLVADRNLTKPVLDAMDIGAEKGRGFSRTELPIWSQKTPIRVHGMLLAGERLYLAGPPDLAPDGGAYEAMIGKRGAVFRVVATSDGSKLAEFRTEEVPVFDGLIAAGDRLYMSTMDGTLLCLGEKP